jgi:sugar phosphate isomerase/epimerase
VLNAIKGHSARIGACADTGHWTRSGLNAVDCLKKLEGHVITLHFKDVNDEKKDVPFGQGKTDIKGMMAELKRQNFHGTFSLEYESGAAGEQLINELKECIAFFDREAAQLAH